MVTQQQSWISQLLEYDGKGRGGGGGYSLLGLLLTVTDVLWGSHVKSWGLTGVNKNYEPRQEKKSFKQDKI